MRPFWIEAGALPMKLWMFASPAFVFSMGLELMVFVADVVVVGVEFLFRDVPQNAISEPRAVVRPILIPR